MRHRHSIEVDSYDRRALQTLQDGSVALQALATSGAQLLPHFDGFLLDLFALAFKMNIVFHPAETVLPSAMFYRLILDLVGRSEALERLRQQTVLDESAAGMATVLLGERLLALLRSERILSRREMLDFWSFHRQEEDVTGARDDTETARGLLEQLAGRPAERRMAVLAQRLERERDLAERRLLNQAASVRNLLADGTKQRDVAVEEQLAQIERDLEAARGDAETLAAQLGGSYQSTAAAQIDLGSRLARNPKLRRMADLVGRMRETARALRRKMYERGNDELYSVSSGNDLSHLLPSELIGLRHPILRRDFLRRHVEGELLGYQLRVEEKKGRGPMVVCLDGSSSMAGEKEIWSKAVTLTLLDLSRRQRRRFRSICFSGGTTPLQIFDQPPTERGSAQLDLALRIADYFPGGGTDFRPPLAAAVECLQSASHRRGDIVLITDGECGLDPAWLERFRQEKKQLGFSVLSVLIDVGPSSLAALRQFSDEVTSVTQLTSEASRELFLKL